MPSALAGQRRVPLADRRRRAGTPSARRPARSRAGLGARGRRPSRARTRRARRPSAPPAGERRAPAKPVGRRVRVGVEGRPAVARVAGPPADGDLLRVHRVAHDEVVRRRVGGRAGEQVHGQVERAPPRVDRRRAPAVGRAERGEHQRGLGRGGEVGGDLVGVVAWRARRPRRAAPSTGPPAASGRSRPRRRGSRTAASSSRVTAPTGRSGASATRAERPSLCSATASCVRRSSAATNAPEPSGAGSGSVSHPRAVSRSAACWSCGSGGASVTASLPSTCVWACRVSQVALQVS